MANRKDHLFEEFPPVSTEEWEEVIKRDLRGADYKEKLKWDTGEGIDILPFYRKENLPDDRAKEPIRAGLKENKWSICCAVFDQDVVKANKTALNALQHGADALQFEIKIKSTSGMLGGDLEGTSVQTQQEFNTLLRDIKPESTRLIFDSAMASPIMLAMLKNMQEGNITQPVISAVFSYDPFGYVAQKGQFPKREELLKNEIIDLVRNTQSAKNIRPLCADARLWHNAGGTIVHELGLSLAAASEYMALLTDNGFKAGTAAEAINFMTATGSKYFPEIAKFRALRLLWNQLLEAYEVEKEVPAYVHAETSVWNKTVFDPYVNMLRSTTEGMSAAIGGIDSLTIHPFDRVFEQPDNFSERIAKNTQIIMQEEAYFDKVTDPAAGSYYIEKLTDKIAGKAWALFQEIEQEGGLLKSLQNGTVQTSIESAQKHRDREIATRGRIFVGTNQYPNPDEVSRKGKESSGGYSTVSLKNNDYDFALDSENKEIIHAICEALSEGAAIGDLIPKLFQEDWSKHNYRTIETYRGSKAFEELRLATENHEHTPTVLTLPLGDKKMRKARSTFTTNFFGCVGYHIEDPIGFESTEEAINAVKAKEPDIIVICSSDENYKQLVPKLCEGIGSLQKKPITVLAGYPKDRVEEFRQAGIDEFIHAKCNVLETLEKFHQKLGIIERG